MESKTHLLLFLSTLVLLLHSHPSIATCVQRNVIHMLHNLLPPPLSAPAQPVSSSIPPSPSSTPSLVDSISSSIPPSPSPTPSLDNSISLSVPSTPSPAQPVSSDLPDYLMASKHVSSTVSSAAHEALLNLQSLHGHQTSAWKPSPAVDAAIKNLCAQTDYVDLCVTSISSFQLGPGPINAAVILQVAIKASIRHAQAALNDAKKHAANPSLPPFTAQNMKVCEENYSSALDNLQNAAKAATANDKGTLNSMLSAAMTDFNTCADGFMEMPGASPLASYDVKLPKLASNCLAIASKMN